MPYSYHNHFHFAPVSAGTLKEAIARATKLHRVHQLRYVVWSLADPIHVTPPERMPIGATKHFDTDDRQEKTDGNE